MKRPVVQMIVWLALMAVFTLLAMGGWLLFSGGSQSTASLKWLQLAQTIGTFIVPALLGAWLWNDHKPFAWLRLNRSVSWQTVVFCIAIMVCAIPAINLLADLNGRIVLPQCLESVEQFLRAQEDAAAKLTERFLQADNVGMLLVNLGLMAFLPALAEETSFRGTLQQLLGNRHAAIWVTAFIFSAIHMQFYGFIPRMLMGAMFGYIFVWTGSLWAPVLMHFVNNGIAVIVYYFANEEMDTIGTGQMWWVGVLSLIVVSVLLYFLQQRMACEKRTPFF